MPPTPTSRDDYDMKTLSLLLDQGTFFPVSARTFSPDRAPTERFYFKEKTTLALELAISLMDLFDQELELASHTWDPDNIFFRRSSGASTNDESWYISLRPNNSDLKHLEFLKVARPCHPVLVSFAKLLLEIRWGEKLPLEHPQYGSSYSAWGWMCTFLDELQRDGGSPYLEAVHGCLYLHLHHRLRGAAKVSRAAIREAIHELVVRNLELELNPENRKRKRQDPSFESPSAQRHSTAESIGTESHPLLEERSGVTVVQTVPSSIELDAPYEQFEGSIQVVERPAKRHNMSIRANEGSYIQSNYLIAGGPQVPERPARGTCGFFDDTTPGEHPEHL